MELIKEQKNEIVTLKNEIAALKIELIIINYYSLLKLKLNF